MTSPTRHRQRLRRQRRALTSLQQDQASHALRAQLKRLPGMITAKRVGAYLANDGEIDPRLMVAWLWQTGKAVYLPILSSKVDKAMGFGLYQPTSCFKPNQFAILEPVCQRGEQLRAQNLDVILLPLVGFDDHGNRCGMGGGYYDRALAFKQSQPYTRRPKLVGLAHHFQQVEAIRAQPWDIPLDAVATDQDILIF